MTAQRLPNPGDAGFAKYHALGNDYIVVDGATFPALKPAEIVALCDRHTGIGSDGILRLVPATRADFGLRIHNPDGSEAEKSGNGLRIFVRFLVEYGYTDKQQFQIETPGGIVDVRVGMDKGSVSTISIAMGRATFTSEALHMAGPAAATEQMVLDVGGEKLDVTCVSMGNPHCVVFGTPADRKTLLRLGPAIESHPMFTRRINVQLARPIDRCNVEALIWERGAGETRASGSSSCAVAAACKKRGLVDEQVTVRMAGGHLQVRVDDADEVTMTGNATPVYQGLVRLPELFASAEISP